MTGSCRPAPGTLRRKIRPGGSGPGSRVLAVTALPAVMLAGFAGAGGAAPAPGSCIPVLFCPPPGPAPVAASPGSSGSGDGPSPVPPSRPLPPPGTPGRPVTGGKAAAGKNAAAEQAGAPPGLVAPRATSVLTAQSSVMTRFSFAGVAVLPQAGGGSEKALEFTASTAVLSAVTIAVSEGGKTAGTTAASLRFPAGMTLYTTKLCGRAEGIAPDTCFTPDTASRIILKLAGVIGASTPVTMTGITAARFISLAPASQWGTFTMRAG